MTYLIPHIAVLNASDSTCTDGEIDAMIMAIQHQVTYQFRPWWGVNASIQRYADESAIPTAANVWTCRILNQSDVHGAGGYHEETHGVPDLKVFAGDLNRLGASVSVAFSHEVLEALGDPLGNQSVQVGRGIFWAMEACDAVEADQFGYDIPVGDTNITVSDFVTRQWWNVGDPPPYDYKRHLTRPLQLLAGGYIGEWSASTQRWTQRVADETAPASRRIALRNARLGDADTERYGPAERIEGQLRLADEAVGSGPRR
jgi:hypothetical protein